MECLTGSLISERGDISYINSYAFKPGTEWEKVQRLPAQYFEDRLDAGQVDRLLPTESDEWIHSVDAPVLISRGRHWLPVRIDLEKQKVHHLPEQWQKELAPVLLAKAAGINPPVRIETQNGRVETATTEVETCLAAADLLTHAAAHHGVLKTALLDAKTTVVIASAFLDTKAMDGELRNLIIAALKRGVQVNLLWGYAAGQDLTATKVAMRWLRDIRRETGASPGLLRFNGEPTESHAKILIYDGSEGHIGYVGSYNWLSTPLTGTSEDFIGSNVSVRLRHPGLTASLYRTAASLWLTSRGGQMSETPERLRRYAASLEEQARHSPEPKEESPNSCLVRLVRDREHTALLRDVLLYEDGNVLVTSHKLGDIAPTRLASRQPSGGKPANPLIVNYGESFLDSESFNSLVQSTASAGVKFSLVGHMHAKVVATKDRAIISSFNFLSADPFGNQARAREVGVLIEGGNLPEFLLNLPVGRTVPTPQASSI
jgi:phosphatidylserine/phosphatidylglycerophosphate/cardiolipin synthase-like enzyme